jgi:DNA-binding NarL/FixJ family response regulator
MNQPTVILADDHALVAEALRRLLEPDFNVLATANDGRTLVAEAVRLRPQVVVTDIAMPMLNGLDAGAQLKTLCPEMKMVFLTQYRDSELVAEAFRRGGSGYMTKTAASSELFTAIHEVLQGRIYISQEITNGVPGDLFHKKQSAGKNQLTIRQREVLQLLAEGCSMKKVAEILKITPRTVQFHKYRIMELLNLETNAELVQYAMRQAIIAN